MQGFVRDSLECVAPAALLMPLPRLAQFSRNDGPMKGLRLLSAWGLASTPYLASDWATTSTNPE